MENSENIVYKCPKFVVVEEDFELPEGRVVKRYPFIKRGPGALILAFKESKLLLLKEYRPILGSWVYQLPGGKIEQEEPLIGARREVEEETGYSVDSIKLLFESWLSPSFIKQKNYFFVAQLSDKGEQKLESDETIKTEFVTLNDAVSMIIDGEITSMPSVAGILYYAVTQSKK